MKRFLCAAAVLAISACGKQSKVELTLASNDSALMALAVEGATATAPVNDLTNVKAIVVTVASVSVHIAGSGAPDTVSPTADPTLPDDASGWVVLSDVPKTYDLVQLKSDFTLPLASGTVPAGKITQIRLALAVTAPEEGAAPVPFDVIVGAVTELDGTICDLLVPHSAFNPGIKLVHPFKALPVPEGGTAFAAVNLRVKESTRETTPSGCAYRLYPVIQIQPL